MGALIRITGLIVATIGIQMVLDALRITSQRRKESGSPSFFWED
jgi:hypothetical protein